MATKFVENDTYEDENGNIIRHFDKQDCELKASYRLMNKIRKRFSKLPIIIGGDACYIGKLFLKKGDECDFNILLDIKKMLLLL